MHDGPLTHRERTLLQRLATLAAERASREDALIARVAAVAAESDAAHEELLAEADEEHAEAVSAAEREFKQAAGQIRAKYEGELRAARRKMDAELRVFEHKTESIESAGEKDFQDAKWLAETIVESGEGKIRLDHDLACKRVAAGRAEIARAVEAANALLAQHGHPLLPRTEPPAPAGADPDAELEAAKAEVAERYWRLDERIRPGWLQPIVIVCVAVLTAGAGAGAALATAGAALGPIAFAAGIGAALGLGLMLLLRSAARGRVPAARNALAQAVARAEAAAEASLAAAEAERDRQHAALHARRDREVREATEKFAIVKREVDRRRKEEEPQLRAGHEAVINDLQAKLSGELAALERACRERTEAAARRRRQRVSDSEASRNARLAQVRAEEDAELASLEQTWKSAIADAHAQAAELNAASRNAAPDWDHPSWRDPVARASAPQFVPFGRLRVSFPELPGGPPRHERLAAPGPDAIELPALLELGGRGSLLLKTSPESREQALDLLRAVMLRILATYPPGKARFTIIDPVGLGRSFAGFMHLADYDENLVGGKIWTDTRHIESRLTDLSEHMETVIQKYLRNEFSSIQEYNAQAGEVAEPYRFLVIADLPANFNEPAARRLASIVNSGARCGVYTLIAADLRGRLEEWIPLADLERSSVTLAWRGGRFACEDDVLGRFPLEIDASPGDDHLTEMVHAAGRAAKSLGRVQVPFDTVAPPAGELWSLDTTEAVRVPLGRAGARKLQHLLLGHGTAQHALIAGRTGSGKSTLLHVLITNLALWYSPDEIEMYLVDFKKGVEFKTYAAHQMPHARVVAVESEREFGLSVLRKLDAELTRRGSLFREAGVQDVAGYRRSAAARDAAPLPRVMLIVDEFQEFFVEDDKLAQEASLLLDRLVRQGRAFGMHVVLGSQTLGGAYGIARSTMGQMGVRIALQCSEADSYLILSEDNAAARLLSRPGEAIYNDASGLVEGNSPFQIVWLDEDRREQALNTVRQLAASTGRSDPPPIVFEGNIPADLPRNHLLASLLSGAAVPAPGGPQVWLGDAISIKDPTAFTFRRQSGSNLLIVGHQDDAAMSITLASLVALAAHHAAAETPPRMLVLDGAPADSLQAGLLEPAAAQMPFPTRTFGVRDAGSAVAELAAELDKREADENTRHPPAYLVVYGLQRFRDLRKSDDFSFSMDDEKPGTPGAAFARILRDGPAHGIHTIVWCDTAANVERFFERSTMREFDARVLFQMSATDSTHLIETPAAGALGRHRALLYQEELGTLEKFRPYAMPPREWVAQTLATLRRRAGDPAGAVASEPRP